MASLHSNLNLCLCLYLLCIIITIQCISLYSLINTQPMPTQAELPHCQQLSKLLDQIPTCKSTQQLDAILSIMDGQLSARPSYFMNLLGLLMNSHAHNQSTKLIAASYLARHLQKHYLYMGSKEEHTSSMRIQMNKHIHTLSNMIESEERSGEQYRHKAILIEMYIKMTLQINTCRESVSKLVSTAKYYYGKRKNSLALMFTQKLLTNPRHKQSQVKQIGNSGSEGNTGKYNTKSIQAYSQLVPLLIDNLHHNTSKLCHSEASEHTVRECMMGMDVLAQIISDTRNNSKCMDTILGNAQIVEVLEQAWRMGRQCAQMGGTSEWKHRLFNTVLHMSQQLLSKWHRTTVHNHPKVASTLLRVGQALWQMCVEGQQNRMNNTTIGMNTSITNILVSCIKIQGSTATHPNGHKHTQFHGGSDYLLRTFLFPVYLSFQGILSQADCTMEGAIHMVAQLQNHIFTSSIEEGEDASEQEQVHLWGSQTKQPIAYAHLRILNKLSLYFPEVSIGIKVLIHTMLAQTSNQHSDIVLQMCRQHGISSYQMGMIVGGLCTRMLMKHTDWLHQLHDMFCRIHTTLQHKQETRRGQRQRVAGLLLYRMHMDDALYEVSSQNNLIDTCISIATADCAQYGNVQIAVCLDILLHYYSTFLFPYQHESHRVEQILRTLPNKYSLQLHLQIIRTYGHQISAVIIREWAVSAMEASVMAGLSKHQCMRVLETAVGIVSHAANRWPDYQQCSHLLHIVMYIVSWVLPRVCSSSVSAWQQPVGAASSKQVLAMMKQCLGILGVLAGKHPQLGGYQQQYKTILIEHLRHLLSNTQFTVQKQSECEQPQSTHTHTIHTHIQYIYVFHPLLFTGSHHTVSQLVDMIVAYLNTHQSIHARVHIQTVTQLLIMLHNCIMHAPEHITHSHIQGIISAIASHSDNKNNSVVRTGVSYLYAGKIYLTLLLLLEHKPVQLHRAINQMRYDHARGETKFKNAITQVFCNPRNYVPNYDVPIVIATLSTLLRHMAHVHTDTLSQSQGMLVHVEYAHFYFKLLAECVQRLHAYNDSKVHDWQQPRHGHSLDQEYYNDIKLLAYYQAIDHIVTLPINYEPINSDAHHLFSKFKAVYCLLCSNKRIWAEDILRKFVSPSTINFLQYICNQVPTSTARNIVTVKKPIF